MKTLRVKKSAIINDRHKRLVYAVSLLLWLSGAAWLALKYFPNSPSLFNAPLWLKIHGAAAMVFLLVFGALIHQHIPAGWKENRERPSGVSLAVSCGILVITGWGLYYVGIDSQRNVISATHSWLGLALPLIIFLHIWKR